VVRAGCANVAYVRFGYKPEVHFPEIAANDDERERFACDVMFAGSSDSDRAPYFETLVREIPGLKLHLYGGFWNRVPSLRPYARAAATGRDYRLAIGGAKICVNLVRRANRDDHVMRTFEIPACAGFMLTEQTAAHSELFNQVDAAIFFSSPDQLVAKVRSYLGRDADRARIAQSMHRAICEHGHTYADRLDQILDTVRPLMTSRRLNSQALASTREFEPNG
jgi:spore maturation protein CgeB